MKVRKISSRRSLSLDYAELGHSTLMLCSGRQRNIKTDIKRTCTTIALPNINILFGDVLVAVPSSTWFAKLLIHTDDVDLQ